MKYPFNNRQLSREALVSLLGEERANEFIATVTANHKVTYQNSLPEGFDINNAGDEIMAAAIADETEKK